jgi:nucleotide-binding universal stress UspA family protein
MFQRILVPLDGSTRAESALPVAARLARAYGGSLILVEVIETSRDYGAYRQPLIEEEKGAAKEYLEGVAKSEQAEGVASEVKVLAGAVGATILETVRTAHADLIVMGSVTERVLHHTNQPLLVVRPPKSAQAQEHAGVEEVAIEVTEEQSWVGLL